MIGVSYDFKGILPNLAWEVNKQGGLFLWLGEGFLLSIILCHEMDKFFARMDLSGITLESDSGSSVGCHVGVQNRS